MVAAASGQPYPQYIEQHILAPLGMAATRVMPDRATPGIAVGYRKRVPGQPREAEDFIDARGLTPAANFASNVEDLAKLMSLQFRTGPVGGAQILRLVDDPGNASRAVAAAGLAERPGPGLLGAPFRVTGPRRPRRRGARLQEPGRLLASREVRRHRARQRLRCRPAVLRQPGIRDRRAGRRESHRDVARGTSGRPRLVEYVGTYTWKHVDVEIMVLNGELTMIVPDAANPWEARVRLTPIGPRTFRMVGGSNSGELLTFDVDATGTRDETHGGQLLPDPGSRKQLALTPVAVLTRRCPRSPRLPASSPGQPALEELRGGLLHLQPVGPAPTSP